MANDEVKKDKRENGWIRNLIFLIFGTAIGFGSNFIADRLKECKVKDELAKMIYIDVNSTKTILKNHLLVYPREKVLEQSTNVININDFDTYVFEAYIHNISLLTNKETKDIILFYRDLKNANEAKRLLRDKDSVLSLDNRKIWINSFYDAVEESVKKAENIMTDLTKQYNIKPIVDGDANQEPSGEFIPATSTIDKRKK
jgi:hypothetical protein